MVATLELREAMMNLIAGSIEPSSVPISHNSQGKEMTIIKLWIECLVFVILVGLMPAAHAATYANAATTFSWIDASSHTKVGLGTSPYAFSASSGCGGPAGTLDDTLSNQVPIGFNFTFGDKTFDAVRVMSNGRIQLVSTTIPLDNTTCGFGSPVTQLPIPIAGLNYTMRIYGNDLDPTPKSPSYNSPCNNGTTAANNPCYVSVGAVGSAPNRRFVVTWAGVPEWVASGSKGAYNVQIILNEGGDFVYQYGTDVPGPAASTAQIGWQLSTTDYDTVPAGFPVPNTAIRFFIPHPLAEYLMEQTSWSGAGSILDTSGYGNNATPTGSTLPTIAASAKVCKGAQFTGTGTQAINSNLAVPSVIGNTGTITFWYKSAATVNWNNSSNVDEVLLDATTASGTWFYLVKRGGAGANAGKLRFSITDSGGTKRVIETAAQSVAAGTWKHIAVTWSFNNYALANNDHLRIYIDGGTAIETPFTSTTLTVASGIGTLFIGGTRSSLADTGLGTGSANGVIDEFRAYNYEATQSTIQTIMNLNSGGCMDHYSVVNAATGLTCQLNQVTVTAHTGSHATYTSYNTVSLSTSDGKGDWSLISGRGLLIPGAANSGNATYAFSGESQFIVGLTHPTAATITYGATDGTYSKQESTTQTISACMGYKFNACESTVLNTVCPSTTAVDPNANFAHLYTKLASTAYTLKLVAVNIDGSLDTTFSKQVAINLLANANAPTINANNNCPTSQTATISLGNVTFASGRATANVTATAFSAVSPNYSAYRDVRVQFVCSAANCGSGGLTNCGSDAFSIRPPSLTVSSSANGDSAGASATAATTVKAGKPFTLTANAATAGYGGSPVIDTTKIEWLSAPAGGRSSPGTGTVAGLFSTGATIATGNGATGAAFTYDEVGYFRFQPGGVYDANFASISGDVGSGDCLASSYSNTADSNGRIGCNIANTAATNYFGRFIPDHFAKSGSVTTTWGCPAGGFTYMDQPFSLSASIEAQNTAGVRTQNYSGAFVRGTAIAQAENANSGTSLASRLTSTAPWSGGSAAFSATKFSRAASPDGSYGSVTIGVQVSDLDTLYLIDRDMDQSTTTCTPDSTGSSDGTCTAVTLGTGVFRYGRLRLQNAYGSEHLPLDVPAHLEYYDTVTGRWLTNTIDSTTQLLTAASGTSAAGYSPAGHAGNVAAGACFGVCTNNLTPNTSGAPADYAGTVLLTQTVTGLATNSTSPTYPIVSAGDSTTFNAGHLRLQMARTGLRGSLNLRLVSPSWLQSGGSDPTALLSYGLYNQGPRIIYRQEIR